jgi:hypothetical protein
MNGEPGEQADPESAPLPLGVLPSLDLQLQPLELWFHPGAGPLLPQVRAALGEQACREVKSGGKGGNGDGCEVDSMARFAEPLRWAITAVDAERGLRLEAVLLIGPAMLMAMSPATETG